MNSPALVENALPLSGFLLVMLIAAMVLARDVYTFSKKVAPLFTLLRTQNEQEQRDVAVNSVERQLSFLVNVATGIQILVYLVIAVIFVLLLFALHVL